MGVRHAEAFGFPAHPEKNDMTDTQRDLPVPATVLEASNPREILRVWTTDAGERVTLRIDDIEPGAWGLMLVDIAKHVAHAYAQRGGLSPNDAFIQVVTMFIAEIQEPTASPQPVDES